jgi:hypothetical protein
MDVHLLRAERRRIAERYRSTLTCLGIMRAQRIGASTEEAQGHLQTAIDEQSAMARELGERLLAVDASIIETQSWEVRERLRPWENAADAQDAGQRCPAEPA